MRFVGSVKGKEMKLIMSWGYVGRHTSDSRLEMAGKRVGE
jgi:hypothetical protein